MAEIGQDIDKAKALLEAGELVAIPTETVYGLAGNAFLADAVAKIFQVKNRPAFNPLILHSNHLEKVKKYVKQIPDPAIALAQEFWPGPLTMLFEKQDLVPGLVTAGLETVAVRIPKHELTLQLLEAIEFPLAAPSANPFGYISPTRAYHVNQQLGDKIPYILDGGACKIGIESTIVGFEADQVVVFRLGGTSIEEIERITGPVKVMPHSSSQPKSPGMLKSHYAPLKQLILGNIEELIKHHKHSSFGIISFRETYPQLASENQVVLSESGDMLEAATRLFDGLRHLDKLPINYIFAELLPDHGLGRAINDRLRRAAVK
ncbi:MAG: L-threonylcarbamoyladenylate synthase [Candidatus Cyclobacteriaceae bacterium M3_2C_046]